MLHCHICFPGGDRLRLLQCQNLLQHPVPHRKSSLTLHACACFTGREPEASLLPPLPPPGLCSLPGQGKGAQMSSMSGNTGLTSLLEQRTSSVSFLSVILRDQWQTIWSGRSSCSLLFPHSWRERGPPGGPGCDHHVYKCGKQRFTPYEPCGVINTDGFSFSYWREP